MRQTLLAVFAVLGFTTAALAQQTPQLPPGVSATDLQRMIRQGGLGAQIRQRIQQSGMTPDQIRARLRAAGYPEDLVDQYLGSSGPDSLVPNPSIDVMRALASLGMEDLALAADSLGRDSLQLTREDSLFIDSLGVRLGFDTIPTMRDSLGATVIDTAALVRFAERFRRLRVFGLDVFRRASTQFQPALTGPVDPGYRVGPGDELVLIITGEVEVTQQLPVTREGFIVIPQVGQVYVANLTMEQLTSLLYTRLGRVYASVRRGAGASSQFSLAMSRVRVNQIFVTGEVSRPGSYPVSALGTVMHALYQAGGPTELANFRAVKVMRAGAEVAVLDLYDYLLRGNTRGDVRLEQGDVVFVAPRELRVQIDGAVVRPALYDLAPGQGLREAIAMAGGLLPEAHTGRVQIERILPPGQRRPDGIDRTLIDADLGAVLDSGATPVRLEPGDKLTVFPVARPVRNRVVVRGNVWRPGTFEAEPGLRLTTLLARAGGLKPDTYGSRAHIIRLAPDSTRRLIPVDLGGVDNPEILEYDEITVFSRTGFRPEREIAVYGAVQRPGVFTFRDSMSLRDAVMLAGGLEDGAYLLEAEIARIPQDRAGSNDLAVALRVPLDSSYVFDPTSYISRQTAARGENPTLEPYDNIFIRRVPGFELQRNVVLAGEVRFPGRYTLLRRDERLLDLINRAGGLTEAAYAGGLTFYRRDARTGPVGVDLPRVLREPAYRDNFILVAGDSIHVPPYQPVVRVEGAVNSPVAVAFVPGRNAGWYVDRAGGFTATADRRRTYIVQANGSVVRRGDNAGPGARVVVPEKPPNVQGTNWAAIIGTIAQVATSAITLVILSRQL